MSCRSSNLRSNAAILWLTFCCIAGSASAQDKPWVAETATRLENLREITLSPDKSRVIVHAGDRRFRLSLPRGLFLLSPMKDAKVQDHGATIPGGRIALGDGMVASARLTRPTNRYRHAVLGDAIEAGGLAVRFRNGGESEFSLPEDSVFEDLEPRIIALDGDEAVLTVRSYLGYGAALALYGITDGTLTPFAESPPIGQAHRWQNPVGAADFDGDGTDEIASVVTPHLSGILTLFRRADTVLEPVASLAGFSNHFIGSTVLGMHLIADINGDGILDIVIPSLGGRRLIAVTFAGGTARVLKTVDHDSRIVTSIVMANIDKSGAPEIVYGLANGSVTVIRR